MVTPHLSAFASEDEAAPLPGTREAELAHAVANILPIGDEHAPGDRVIPIYVRMDELRALRELAALTIEVEPSHSCPACPVGPRDIGAVLHNLVGQLERGNSILDDRSKRKLVEAREALNRWQPVVDAHFAALSAGGTK